MILQLVIEEGEDPSLFVFFRAVSTMTMVIIECHKDYVLARFHGYSTATIPAYQIEVVVAVFSAIQVSLW
jgi:hypothetical protein